MTVDAKQKPPRKASKKVRRRQLIEAAIQTIASRGLSGATTANVTQAAGLSTGIVGLHFDGKDNLLNETLRFLAVEMRDAWVESQSDKTLGPAKRLRAIIEALFDPALCTPTKVAVWFAFFGEAKYRASYRQILDRFDDERSAAIKALCVELKEAGGYETVDPVSLAISVESLADGLWLSVLLYPDWMTTDLAKRQIYDLLSAHYPDHFERSVGGEAGT